MRKNLTAYRDLKFVLCASCKNIHDKNLNCVGVLKNG